MALRLRRGTDAERLLIVPLAGELIYTTDTKRVYVGDGATEGGLAIDTGALSINELSDVNTSTGDSTQPVDGEALLWDSNNQEWRPGTFSSVDTALGDLSNVVLAGLATGQALVYDGANWGNTTLNNSLSGLDDINLTTPDVGSFIKYDGLEWVDSTLSLDELNDVILASVGAKEVIYYDGTDWVNSTIDTADLADVDTTGAVNGSVLKYLDGNWIVGSDLGSTTVSDDTNPSLGGNLDGGGFSISNVDTVTATTLVGDGTGITNVLQLVQDDSAPTLGGNLDLNGFNVIGNGNLVLNNNLQADIIVANSVSARMFGDVTGSIFADDSSAFYDSINHVASVDSLTTNTLISPTIKSSSDTLSIGSTLNPNKVEMYWQGDDEGPLLDVYSSADSIPEIAFKIVGGTLTSPANVQTDEGLGDMSWYGWDGSEFVPGATMSVLVENLPSGGSVPSTWNVFMFNAGAIGATLSFNSAGVLSAPTIDGDLTGSVFADNSTLLVDGVNGTIPGYISIADLKTEVAASTDFADFKTRIAAL
jgi:hypothetical protein